MRSAPPSSIPAPAEDLELAPEVRRDRDRCLRAIRQSDEGSQRIARYADALDDFIRWSLGRDDLEHRPGDGTTADDTLRFVLRGTTHVVWEVSADAKEGAKLIALPKTTSDLPEAVRAEVRQRFGGIDHAQDGNGVGRLRLWMRFLLMENKRRDAQEALAWALDQRASRQAAARA